LLQEVDAPVHINRSHESHELEKELPSAEGEQERAVGKDILDLARDNVRHQVVRVLNILHQELVELGVAEDIGGVDHLHSISVLQVREHIVLINSKEELAVLAHYEVGVADQVGHFQQL
jgi:hypothetical protein